MIYYGITDSGLVTDMEHLLTVINNHLSKILSNSIQDVFPTCLYVYEIKGTLELNTSHLCKVEGTYLKKVPLWTETVLEWLLQGTKSYEVSILYSNILQLIGIDDENNLSTLFSIVKYLKELNILHNSTESLLYYLVKGGYIYNAIEVYLKESNVDLNIIQSMSNTLSYDDKIAFDLNYKYFSEQLNKSIKF